jgi:hypothetical protein
MKMTVTFTEKDILDLVQAALVERGLRAESPPKVLITNESRGDYRETWTEPVFNGVTVDVSDEFK